MKPIIKIENLSKQYRLGTIGTGTLSQDLNRWWARMCGKEDPKFKVGETNDRSIKGTSEYVWALKDINIEVMPGEVLGIIGKNGAGKSTLLKILSKVTGPTMGSIQFNGRIGSLLEVGTGFHPELTGRENIFLNGAILGMTKAEIRSKLDEIIDFSGCERYIDTPVKRYSSGMKVRLGFAVAAHLQPEILVVDEVLAVGDAEFQKKAIGKMQEVSQEDGRTVLFVSHNMGTIQSLCNRLVVLKGGGVVHDGDVAEGIHYYLNGSSTDRRGNNLGAINRRDGHQKGKIIFGDICYRIEGKLIENVSKVPMGASIIFRTHILNKSKEKRKIDFSIIISDQNGVRLTCVSNEFTQEELILTEGNNVFEHCIYNVNLLPNNYSIRYWIRDQFGIMDAIDDALRFEIVESNFLGTGKIPNHQVHGHIVYKQDQKKIEVMTEKI